MSTNKICTSSTTMQHNSSTKLILNLLLLQQQSESIRNTLVIIDKSQLRVNIKTKMK